MSHHYVIKKSFHFHAAHRNEDLPSDPCYSIHGHTYHLDCHFSLQKEEDASFTVTFGEIQKRVGPVIAEIDHSLILNRADPLYLVIKDQGLKLYLIDHTSSAENLARLLFERIRLSTGLNLTQLDLRETTSSVVSYTGH